MDEACRRFKGTALAAKIGKLCFAVVTYYLWQERNARIFGTGLKSTQQVLNDAERFICARVWGSKVKREYNNRLVCKN